MAHEQFPTDPWYLRSRESGKLIRAMDGAGSPFVVYRTLTDAKAGAEACMRNYGFDADPVSPRDEATIATTASD